MINTLIFDFGNVFINLDIEGNLNYAFEKFKIDSFSEEMMAFNSFYEQGLISTEELLGFYSDNFPHLSNEELISIWNFMLKDFPKHRLDFIQQLKKEDNYKLILLSNTNDLHIDWIKEQVPFFEDFKACFHQFYLSHEIQLRKPNKDIFEFVLGENNLNAHECFFIDDNTDNCNTAETMGIKTWNINPKTDDVTTLFETKADIL
ncbi:HAD-IA family hydrolase [Aestuariibaculum sp. YM273]|uniref:HAD-IA family hydrolase n=1 Tax=Aestuariibaculum sp. YM273 TaxID=3070659 RepID=UPI0027DD25E7|nr:HAD-IA family hydrolase [Aestuariibaculum sp. YM273]WMI65564.1 HAD-IA family hydrolase [Aestuariibaculum sp. YM273]